MKNLKILSCAIVILITVFSCSKNEVSEPLSSESNQNLLERPNLKIGESNWVTTESNSKQALVAGLMTEDLNTITADDLVSALIGNSIDAPIISNVVYSGSPIAAGTFTGGTGIIGFEDGIILSTGNIASTVGPNSQDGTSTSLGSPGDLDLNGLIPGYATLDATVLEFDFECENTQNISFQYVFTSEEYNEYVNSEFNDVFGFFLNGQNIALIPGFDDIPVAINTINCGNPYNAPAGTNCNLYINNDLSDEGGSINIEMDGLTVVLTATHELQPGVNHIKLAIADAGDRILDSNVFIKGESFICAEPSIDINLDIHPTSCPNPLS
jgi:hypothetical protein